jgi:hypothetical protein
VPEILPPFLGAAMKTIKNLILLGILATSAQAFAIAPFTLAYNAYWGKYRDAGIRGYGAFCNQFAFEKNTLIAALIGNALFDESLTVEDATPEFEGDLAYQIQNICRR